MIYLFQRTIQNHFQWTRPSPGRLVSGEGEFVQLNGFGHEDWNFNKNLLVNGNIYGYCYYHPTEAKKDEKFNFVFATYTNKLWYLVGFYLNCKFVAEPPVNKDVVLQKIRDMLQLGNSLGHSYRELDRKHLIKTIMNETLCLKWCVSPENVIKTNQPIQIPNSVFTPRNFRIVNPTELNKKTFEALYSLAENSLLTDYGDDSEFPEGKEQEIIHKTRERNQLLIKKAKDLYKKEHGHLFCEVCGFDFQKKYGAIGSNFIEAHHTIPIHTLRGEVKTKIADIAMVCSNCHKMLHRKRPWLEKNQLKRLINKNA